MTPTDQPVDDAIRTMPTQVYACCPRCPENTPLIGTMMFPRAEFFCLSCGGRFGFMAPRRPADNQVAADRYMALEVEWNDNVARRVITPRAWHKDCDRCKLGDDAATHDQHATDEEWAHDMDARRWIRQRIEQAAAA